MAKRILNKILKFNYLNNWIVTFDSKSKYLTFENWNNYGKNIMYEDIFGNARDFLKNFQSFVDNFDVSYETYIWLDQWGNGVNGAPTKLEDVLNSTKEELKMLKHLKIQLEQIIEGVRK